MGSSMQVTQEVFFFLFSFQIRRILIFIDTKYQIPSELVWVGSTFGETVRIAHRIDRLRASTGCVLRAHIALELLLCGFLYEQPCSECLCIHDRIHIWSLKRSYRRFPYILKPIKSRATSQRFLFAVGHFCICRDLLLLSI